METEGYGESLVATEDRSSRGDRKPVNSPEPCWTIGRGYGGVCV